MNKPVKSVAVAVARAGSTSKSKTKRARVKSDTRTQPKRLLTRSEHALIAEYRRLHPLAKQCPVCGLASIIGCPHMRKAA